jgi:dihydrofolate reductase/thymidylate synthase
MVSLIVARDKFFGIGKDGKIPWHIPEEMAFFKNTTASGVVCMGRKTWDSIPNKNKPLSGRINIILTSKKIISAAGEIYVSTWDELLTELSLRKYKTKEKFVIGGSTLYDQFLKAQLVTKMYVTEIPQDHKCNLHFEFDKSQFSEPEAILKSEKFTVMQYKYINKEEMQVIDTLRDVINNGYERNDRTGIGNISIFCREMRFSLTNNKFPFLTTRPLPLRQIFYELMWFLQGRTDNQWLREKKTHIWDANSNSEFLKANNLQLNEWDCGPTYGFQMRHHGAKYINCNTDYTGQGKDQLRQAIELIKSNPDSRRIIIDLWNPDDIDKMALPPCAYCYQFRVEGKYLSCKLTQRSSDIALAGGWNIATASLLTILIAKVTNLEPKEVVWSPSDIHIYKNQTACVNTQLSRLPNVYPLLKVNYIGQLEDAVEELCSIKFKDLQLQLYDPLPRITIAMNA